MTETKCCFYFTRLTVREDDVFLPLPKETLAAFAEFANQSPDIHAIVEAYRRRFEFDLIEELKSPKATVGFTDKGIFETGIYAAFAFFLEKMMAIEPNCLAFYSSGHSPALIYSRALRIDEYLDVYGPIQTRNFEIYRKAGRQHQLVQARMQTAPEDNLVGFIKAIVREKKLQRVFFKDKAHHTTCNVAGDRADVSTVMELARGRFKSLKESGMSETPAAHLPFYDWAEIKEMFKQVNFDHPRHLMIGLQGQEYSPMHHTRDNLHEFTSAHLGPMNTGEVAKTIARHADRVIVIGSPRGSTSIMLAAKLNGHLRVELGSELVSAQLNGL